MFTLLKLILCLVLGFSGSHARSLVEIKAWFMELGADCVTNYPLSADEMTKLQNHEIPDTQHVKCFSSCVFKKAKFMNDKGVFDVEAAKDFANKEHLGDAKNIENSIKLYETCKSVNDIKDNEEGCERAYQLSKCLLDNASKMGIDLNALVM